MVLEEAFEKKKLLDRAAFTIFRHFRRVPGLWKLVRSHHVTQPGERKREARGKVGKS